MCNENDFRLAKIHPRRPRGSHSGREKRRDESFQAQAEEPLNTDSHQTISKRSSERWVLIGHKKMLCNYCASAQSANSRVTAPGCPRMAKVGRQKGSTERTRLIFSHRHQTSLFNKELIILSDMA